MTENTATAAQSLERSDRALLRRLAFEAQAVAATQRQLASATTQREDSLSSNADFVASYAQRVAEAAMRFETVRELVLATGAAARNSELVVAALEGNDEPLY